MKYLLDTNALIFSLCNPNDNNFGTGIVRECGFILGNSYKTKHWKTCDRI